MKSRSCAKWREAEGGEWQVLVAQRLFALKRTNLHKKYDYPDHRSIKRIVRPMRGFKSFRCASILLAGIETMHMIKKGQLDRLKAQASTAASQFYSLAFDHRPITRIR